MRAISVGRGVGMLADAFLGGQRGKPNRPRTAHPVQRERGRRAQIGAVTEKPRGQVQSLIEKLTDAFADFFISGRVSHQVSISSSSGPYSGNLTQGFCTTQHAFRRSGRLVPPQSPGGLRSLLSRSATMMLTPHEPGPRAVAVRPIPPLCPHHAASRPAVRKRVLD